MIGNKPGSLTPKAMDRIGTRIGQLTAEVVSDPLPPSLAGLMEELEQDSPRLNQTARSSIKSSVQVPMSLL